MGDTLHILQQRIIQVKPGGPAVPLKVMMAFLFHLNIYFYGFTYLSLNSDWLKSLATDFNRQVRDVITVLKFIFNTLLTAFQVVTEVVEVVALSSLTVSSPCQLPFLFATCYTQLLSHRIIFLLLEQILRTILSNSVDYNLFNENVNC